MHIVTFGVEGRRPEEFYSLLARRAVSRIIDVRMSRPKGELGLDLPAGRIATVGETPYIWVPELAAKTLRSALARGEALAFSNLEAGVRALGRYFTSDSTWLFLGHAADPMHDARGHLAAKYADELGAIVVHDVAMAPVAQGGFW